MDTLGESSVFVLLFQIMQLAKYQAVKRMEELELKPSQAAILFSLHCKGNMSQRELAEMIGITPPSMTVALRKMEERGYIVRKTDSNDQRVIRIQLASKGVECVEGVKGVIRELEEITVQGLSPEEKILVKRLLREMRINLLGSKDFKGMDMCEILEKTKPILKNK